MQIIPVLAFPNDDGTYTDAMVDSRPQIMRLDSMFGERSLVPADPVVAFIDYLIEDYGDEWVTKPMYHCRWYYDAAIDKPTIDGPFTTRPSRRSPAVPRRTTTP